MNTIHAASVMEKIRIEIPLKVISLPQNIITLNLFVIRILLGNQHYLLTSF
jgi:hypothetical protein